MSENEPAATKLNLRKTFGTDSQLRRAGSHNSGSESPFRSVVNKGDFRSRLQSGAQSEHRVTVDKDEEDEEEAQRSTLKNIFKEPRTVIQDMIDMSLSKKKLVTSEKMLMKAFVEFYRGLNLLKSYRYDCVRVCGPLRSLMLMKKYRKYRNMSSFVISITVATS